jgi:hypothetical protein
MTIERPIWTKKAKALAALESKALKGHIKLVEVGSQFFVPLNWKAKAQEGILNIQHISTDTGCMCLIGR